MSEDEAKPLRLTLHAEEKRRERGISLSWVEATVREPQWVLSDPVDPAVQRRFRAIAENEGRILRVACVETDAEIRIITVLFDRDARQP